MRLPISTPRLPFVFLVCLAAFWGARADAQTIYGSSYAGADGVATLVTIDAGTGAATPVGSIGFQRCGGIDFDAAGTLYATCERDDGSDTPVLVTIDLATGAGTEVGPTGLTGAIGDISFRSDGTLFAIDVTNDPDHTLATIDTTTGAATVVGDTGLSFAGGNGMSFDGAGTLFHSQFSGGPSPDLNTLDTVTGMPTFVGQITPVTGRFSAMDFDPASGTLFGNLNEGSGGSGPVSLATIDPTGPTATVIGVTDSGVDGIAILAVGGGGTPVVVIPTLNTLGLLALLVVLGGLGVWQLSRRRRQRVI